MKKAEAPLQITRIEDIQAIAGERIEEFAGWTDEQPFVAKVRRVSLLDMITQPGKIPNNLMGTVFDLYQKSSLKGKDNSIIAETMKLIVKECLIEPSVEQLDAASIQLTDLQITQIYLYAMQGVDALRPFRKEQSVLPSMQNGSDVAAAAQRVAESL